ncbi:cyclase family protein [Rhodococcus sp. B10]|uniref:cyclase family protein n=1 Tax=Rhodococcus sp. B10 TaxID=2695876 RepID=UPI00143142C0|nr:cyclase family protein [Rhodococcus sp. B10]NIL77318.1 Kynurenine formamidase [Rhodococcus sp. B10]
MCDYTKPPITGWAGWPCESTSAYTPVGPWLDATHVIDENIPRMVPFDAPVFSKFRTLEDDMINVSEISMVVHIGTHVDSPRHFYADGPAFEDVPLERLTGPGVVVQIDVEPGGVISAEHFENATPSIEPGDIVALDTGWAAHVGTDTYLQHPSIDLAGAQWLADREIKMLAVDFGSPDLPTYQRPTPFDWPVHRLLLKAGVLISEHLKPPTEVSGRRAEFIFAALNIRAYDGAPARVLVRPTA